MVAAELSRIEKKIVIRAPRQRVWRALTSIEEFSKWFRVESDDQFAPGARVRMVSTHESCKGVAFYVDIQEMTPERLFSWRWHPGLPEPGVDYSKEPTTLVEFRLEDVEGGTMVRVVESGFDRLSLERRARIYEGNEAGWQHQMVSLEQYVRTAA